MKTYQQPSAVIEGVEVFYIPGYEGFYSVSKCGKVWSHERVTERGEKGPKPVPGQWRSTSLNDRGRECLTLFRDGKYKRVLIQRLLAITFLGATDKDIVDHIDRDPSNNDLSNLRLVDASQNKLNQKLQKSNKSGHRGVNWYPSLNKWVCRITARNKRVCLGYFENLEDAAIAYDTAAKIVHGEFAELNLPDSKKEARFKPSLLEKLNAMRAND